MLKQRFDYNVWLKNPDIKLVTTNGSKVHHLTDHFVKAPDAPFPLAGIIDGKVYSWSITGCIDDYSEKVDFGSHALDLWMIMPEIYVNVFNFGALGISPGAIHYSYEEALQSRNELQNAPVLGTYRLVKV